MKSFKKFVTEVEQNGIGGKKDKSQGHESEVGQKIGSNYTHFGTLKNGDHIYHKTEKDKYKSGENQHHYAVANPRSKKINIHLKTLKKEGEASEKVDYLHSSDSSKGAHHLYHHLVTKHDKIITSRSQSDGARKVWHKVSKMPGVNIHQYHPSSNKAHHLDPTEDHDYTKFSEWDKAHQAIYDTKNKKDRKKAIADRDDINHTTDSIAVMHKKVK